MKPGQSVIHNQLGRCSVTWVGPQVCRVELETGRVITVWRKDLDENAPVIHEARQGMNAAWEQKVSKWVM